MCVVFVFVFVCCVCVLCCVVLCCVVLCCVVLCCVLCVVCVVCVLCAFVFSWVLWCCGVVVVFKIFVGVSKIWVLPRTPLPWTPPPRTPSAGPPKISLFFPLPPQFSFLSSSLLRVFSWNFGGVFEGRDLQMCTFGLSKRAHFRPRRFKHCQN